jgi:hypothetical protein
MRTIRRGDSGPAVTEIRQVLAVVEEQLVVSAQERQARPTEPDRPPAVARAGRGGEPPPPPPPGPRPPPPPPPSASPHFGRRTFFFS